MSNTTLHLIMGLPGAGKTTLAKALQEVTGAVRITSDEYRLLIYPKPTFSQKEHDSLYAMIDHNVTHLLEMKLSVIYDANLNRYRHRLEKYNIAKKYGVDVQLWWVKIDKDIAKDRRTKQQDHKLLPKDETSSEMFERIAEVIEPPKESEAYIEIVGKDITPELVQKLLEKNTSS